ncbi:MAG: MFS transporter, partial [Chloroflexi bacterium]|nr:MFS transporter [Chloroflexota bacterium]
MNSGRPAPLRGPFGIYYGWVIVASALLMNLATSPLNPVTYSFFMLPMGHDLGWSRSEMSLAITFRLVAAGVTAPILGGFMDRIGSRWMGMYAGFVAGASLIAIAYTDQLWMLYAVYTISGSAGFGGPGGALLTTVPVGKWFIVRRGRAMAIATVGFPIGTVIAIQVAQWLIDTAGWRTAWLVFGVALLAIILPVSGLFMRRSPEDHGLYPDGAEAPVTPPSGAAAAPP